MAGFNQTSPRHLMRRIGLPDAPQVLDVRTDDDFDADPRLIPGARRIAATEVAIRAVELARAPCVVSCHGGLKLSQGAAALIRAAGGQAEALEGGHLAWAAAELPLVPADMLPHLATGRTLWVTRHRPKIDRIACPWLIRRFLDRDATFLFVSPAEVAGVAERFGATPFDIEGGRWSHRGEHCTFDVMISDLGLATEALERLALVVRGADTNRHDLAPQAAGLLAASVGMSRMFRDDNAQLEAALPLYDALYRWARDGFDEGHDWPNAR